VVKRQKDDRWQLSMATSGRARCTPCKRSSRPPAGRFTLETAICVLSLILWALVITISVKYRLFVIARTTMARAGSWR
jgi:hypothetical protein